MITLPQVAGVRTRAEAGGNKARFQEKVLVSPAEKAQRSYGIKSTTSDHLSLSFQSGHWNGSSSVRDCGLQLLVTLQKGAV